MVWGFPLTSAIEAPRSKLRRIVGPVTPLASRGACAHRRIPEKRRDLLLLVLAVLIAFSVRPGAAHAFDIVPFNTRNQSPFSQIFGLPAAGSAVLTPRGHGEFHVTLDHASNFVNEETPAEQILLDGETTRLTLGGRYGLARNMEIGVGIPTVYHSGGFLDGFIISYHDLFGFPQGGRDQAPRNRLLYEYRRNGVYKVRVDSSGGGLGDVVLTAGLQLYNDAAQYPRAVALRAAIKLPTGDSSSLYGSGSTDCSLWISAANAFELPIGDGAVFGAAGLMVMTTGDVLPEQQADHVGFGSIGVGWKPLTWIAFKVQMDLHTPFYRDSDFEPLSANAAQLLIGGTLGLSERTSLDIAVSEDLARKTSPDVAFHFNVSTRF
jgi:hypothetical protein